MFKTLFLTLPLQLTFPSPVGKSFLEAHLILLIFSLQFNSILQKGQHPVEKLPNPCNFSTRSFNRSPIINLALAVIIQASKFDFDDCKSHYFCFTGKVINWVSIYD